MRVLRANYPAAPKQHADKMLIFLIPLFNQLTAGERVSLREREMAAFECGPHIDWRLNQTKGFVQKCSSQTERRAARRVCI
jgi:hypothetical protein